jgi:peptidoglycan/xylan/chitin deacetylase (PgdA/CDA1 family)
MDLLLTFDTEDVYHGPEAGTDDIIKDIADILSDEGVPGNFIFIGERAKLLRERGRLDVIAAVNRHTVGLHTLSHRQPYASVQAAETDWSGGLEIYRKHERAGADLITAALGRPPACLSTHAVNAAPQGLAVAAEMGLPYLYGYAAAPPLFNVSRYCGALNFPYAATPAGIVEPYFEGYDGILIDDTFHQDRDFSLLMEKLGEHIDRCFSAGQPLLMLHPCHPYRLVSRDWVDGFMTANGENIPAAVWAGRPRPRLHPRAKVEIALKNFRHLVRFIRQHPRLQPLSIPDAVKKYGPVPASLTREDLQVISGKAAAENRIFIQGRFSPAEHLLGWSQALTAWKETGTLPGTVPRRTVLGPLEDPIMLAEPQGELPPPQILELAAWMGPETVRTGYLPANVTLPKGGRIGLGHVYQALAATFLAASKGTPLLPVNLGLFERQPRAGMRIGAAFAALAESRVVKPNLDTSRLCRYAKLQAWTLAAAGPGVPDEKIDTRERF